MALASCTTLTEDPVMKSDDEYLWLEEVTSDASLSWVSDRNAETVSELSAHPLYQELYDIALTALSNDSRIPGVQSRAGYLYNFWQDPEHPRGLYRRTTQAEFAKDFPEWETVIDLDTLSAQENIKWDFKGISCLAPDYEHCLVQLSPGGGDAVEIREFDMQALAFVPSGFSLPVGKHSIDWIDVNTVYVGTDFDDESRTDSGYVRKTGVWRRGTPVSDAEIIYTGAKDSVTVSGNNMETEKGNLRIITEALDFWRRTYFYHDEKGLHQLALPETARIWGGYQGELVIYLHSEWETDSASYPAGTLLLASPTILMGGAGEVAVLMAADSHRVIEEGNVSKHGIAVNLMENVTNNVVLLQSAEGVWVQKQIEFPENGSISITSFDGDSGDLFAEFESFTSPPTLYHLKADNIKPVAVKKQTEAFNASNIRVDQFWAISNDGTEVPYFVVRNDASINDGRNPTHIFAYGGFRSAVKPSYSGSYEALAGAYGKLWLQKGGVFVLANIRGGGEFGPSWHEAGLRENRHKVFEDFESVAEDLIRRNITSADKIGIEGRSNGGLLVSATMIRRPTLYGAVICGVPLADMRRYHQLLAGASWIAEYGDPDVPEDWEFLKTYSPFQNLSPAASYPPIFFFTSTRDDRVHPGHARKMMAKMSDQGHKTRYWENIEGGHRGSSTLEQTATRLALSYTHLWLTIGREWRGE